MPHPACNCRPLPPARLPDVHGEDNRPVNCDSCHTDTIDERRDLDDARTACRTAASAVTADAWSHR
jgi:hypothetical protein